MRLGIFLSFPFRPLPWAQPILLTESHTWIDLALHQQLPIGVMLSMVVPEVRFRFRLYFRFRFRFFPFLFLFPHTPVADNLFPSSCPPRR